jgi:spoIIIJ-associated protein
MTNPKYTVDTTGPKIDAFLRTVLDAAGFDLTYEIVAGESVNPEIENPELTVKFTGRDVDLLLSNRAELLLALEHVTMEVLRVPSEDHSRLSFDANDYRLLRIEELRMSATAAAEKVKRTGDPFRFSPMNSRERRVVHLTLRGETTLRSESAGQGAFRHVVIYPAGMASLPDPPPPAFRPSTGPPRDARSRGANDRGGNRGPDRGNRGGPPRGGPGRGGPGRSGERRPFNRDPK